MTVTARLLGLLTGAIFGAWILAGMPAAVHSAPYFEDGFLGLTQVQLRDKLGLPQSVRDRKAALRVFKYYSFADWEQYFKKLIAPQNGEDVYTYKRDGVEVRYSFSYYLNPSDQAEDPTLYVRLVDVEFSPPVPVGKVPALVPEFVPAKDESAPAFRSNIWILLFKGPPSPEAQQIVTERNKDRLDWTLAFQLFSLQGLPPLLTLETKVDRMEISAQSLQLTKQRLKNTHEPMMNPFSREFAERPAPPPPTAKKIPMPIYAD